jgi:hypothetical protein
MAYVKKCTKYQGVSLENIGLSYRTSLIPYIKKESITYRTVSRLLGSNEQFVKELLKICEPKVFSEIDGSTGSILLHSAVLCSFDIFKMVYDRTVDKNIFDKQLLLPFHYAFMSGGARIIEFYVDSNVDLKSPIKYNRIGTGEYTMINLIEMNNKLSRGSAEKLIEKIIGKVFN